MTDAETTIERTTGSPAETMRLGAAIARLCEPGDLIALDGPLGSGKTQFVRGLAGELGADPRVVSSPTYILMQEYPTQPAVVHVDAYRLGSLSDLESAGWDDEILDESLVVVEWAQRIESELPAERLAIEFEHVDEMVRRLRLVAAGEWISRLRRV